MEAMPQLSNLVGDINVRALPNQHRSHVQVTVQGRVVKTSEALCVDALQLMDRFAEQQSDHRHVSAVRSKMQWRRFLKVHKSNSSQDSTL